MLVITLFVIFTCGCASNEINDFDLTLSDDVLFEQFKEVFKKEYKNEEEENMRKEIFVNNLEVIRKNNANSPKNIYGLNILSDRKKEEFPQVQPTKQPKDKIKNIKKYQPVKMTSSCDSKGVYTVDEAFECIDSVEIDEKWKENIIETTKVYLEPYIYTDILKAPPTVEGHENYFIQIDIMDRLNKIKNNNEMVEFYKIYQEIKKVITSCRDGHLSYGLVSQNKNYYIDQLWFLLQGTFRIDNVDDVYLNPREYGTDYPLNDIPEEIIVNKDKKVKEINGENPIEFIQNFGDTYEDSKSPHARFKQALNTICGTTLSSYPLPKEYLKQGLNITYEDGTKVNVKYIIVKLESNYQVKLSSIKKSIRNTGKHTHPLERTYNYILEEMKRKETVNNKKRSEENSYSSNDGSIQCMFLKESEMNVLIIPTFDTEDENSFIETEWKCTEMFDSNNYPIIIILPSNGGGSGPLAIDLVNALSYSPTFETGSFKITNTSELLARVVYCESNKNPQTCEARCDKFSKDLGEWYNNPTIIEYKDKNGNKYEHKISQFSKMIYETDNKNLRELRNKRKPTDIVIFTDGYCYSACSVFVKSMKENGAAIVVGYGGNPNSKYDDVFDDGQSPANVLGHEMFDSIFSLYSEYEQYPTMRNEIGISISVSCLETFEKNFKYDETIPREFIVETVDERIKTLHEYNSMELESFINEGKKIIEKYKSECKSENKKLVKMDESCKGENTDGGFKCGNNNQWTKECKTTMCSNKEYIYDTNKNECIKNTCYSCDVKNCAECEINSENLCIKCEEEYGIVEEENPTKCRKYVCGVGCETCKNDYDCGLCKNGYYLEKGICNPCMDHCDQCSNSATCSKCSKMYKLADDGESCVLKPETYDIVEIVLLSILLLAVIIITIAVVVLMIKVFLFK